MRTIPIDKLQAKPGLLATREPPIMQWKHLDTVSRQKGIIGQKRPRQDIGGDTNSGRQETSSKESSMNDEETQQLMKTNCKRIQLRIYTVCGQGDKLDMEINEMWILTKRIS